MTEFDILPSEKSNDLDNKADFAFLTHKPICVWTPAPSKTQLGRTGTFTDGNFIRQLGGRLTYDSYFKTFSSMSSLRERKRAYHHLHRSARRPKCLDQNVMHIPYQVLGTRGSNMITDLVRAVSIDAVGGFLLAHFASREYLKTTLPQRRRVMLS